MFQNKFGTDSLEDLLRPISPRPISCYRHKKQPITHICTQPKCQNNSLLCQMCISENVPRNYHYEHQLSISPMSEGLQKICKSIKGQINPISKIFKGTLGRSQYASLLSKIEKTENGHTWQKNELAQRIGHIKNQIELELDLLKKEFEKIILVEKQEFYRTLDNYHKAYLKNIQYIKSQTKALIDYEYSVRYFSNKNNLQMKILAETTKKTDWLTKLKKSMYNATKVLQNNSYSSEINGLLYIANKSKIDMWPVWKGEESEGKSISLDLKYFIKRAMTQWVYVPDSKNLQEENQNQFPIQMNPNIGSKVNLRSFEGEPFSKNYYNSKNKQ